jgi:hypothetical protein
LENVRGCIGFTIIVTGVKKRGIVMKKSGFVPEKTAVHWDNGVATVEFDHRIGNE